MVLCAPRGRGCSGPAGRVGEVRRRRRGGGRHGAARCAPVEGLGGLESREHGEGVREVGGRGRGVGRSAHHLVVAVGDVRLLEEGAEGRLRGESQAHPGPAARSQGCDTGARASGPLPVSFRSRTPAPSPELGPPLQAGRPHRRPGCLPGAGRVVWVSCGGSRQEGAPNVPGRPLLCPRPRPQTASRAGPGFPELTFTFFHRSSFHRTPLPCTVGAGLFQGSPAALNPIHLKGQAPALLRHPHRHRIPG